MPKKRDIKERVRAALDEGGPKIRCLDCKDVIQSKTRWDFVRCKCGNVAVDGGTDYLKMCVKDGARWERLRGEEPDENTRGG